jgi:glutamine synthetase
LITLLPASDVIGLDNHDFDATLASSALGGMRSMTATDDIAAKVEADGVSFIYAMYVEMHGKPCAKLVPVEALDGLMTDGAGFAGFASGPMGQNPSSPDMLAIPDPASYTVLPWQPDVAVMQCDPTVEGELWPFAPRVILGQALQRLADRGLTMKTGVEAEYSLVVRNDDGSIAVADERDVDPLPCYDARGLTRMLPHLTEVSRNLNTMGWGNYANDHEDANGQFEQNWTYADAMTTADRLIVFRLMIHTLAQRAGRYATFMPKPFADKTGNGLHTHVSLWGPDGDGATDGPGQGALFPLGDGEDDAKGLGLSAMAYQFAAGLIEHASALAAVACPTVNSYKRMGVGAPVSGATWAPAYAAFGGNNRTQMIRVPEPDRLEVRLGDGAANPYLLFTALAACGMDGVDRRLDPGEPNTANLFELSADKVAARGIKTLPPTLLHAAEELAGDDALGDWLGQTADGPYRDYFAATKRQEFLDHHAQVTQGEVDRYLTLF